MPNLCCRMQFVLYCLFGTSCEIALLDSGSWTAHEKVFFVFATSHDLKQVDSTVRELPLKSHLFCAHARPQSSKEPLHLSTKAGWLEITVISCQVNFSFRMRIVRLWVSKVISPQNGSECHRKQWEGQKITRDKIFKENIQAFGKEWKVPRNGLHTLLKSTLENKNVRCCSQINEHCSQINHVVLLTSKRFQKPNQMFEWMQKCAYSYKQCQ